jgi:hypothetical protein
MKKLLTILAFTLWPISAEARQIILDIPDQDLKIVENDVIDAEQWIKDAWSGKLNKSKSRMIDTEIKRSLSEGSAIPANVDEVIQKHLSRADYENRKQREERAPHKLLLRTESERREMNPRP